MPDLNADKEERKRALSMQQEEQRIAFEIQQEEQRIASAMQQEKQRIDLMMQKREASQKAETQVEGALAGAVAQVGGSFTAKALKFCWLNVIDTYGLTLLYINFHFFAKYLASSNAFCEFGDEWTYEIKTKLGTFAPGSTALKWAEIILLFLVDALVILLVILLIIIIYELFIPPWLRILLKYYP